MDIDEQLQAVTASVNRGGESRLVGWLLVLMALANLSVIWLFLPACGSVASVRAHSDLNETLLQFSASGALQINDDVSTTLSGYPEPWRGDPSLPLMRSAHDAIISAYGSVPWLFGANAFACLTLALYLFCKSRSIRLHAVN